jgi:hypothetical protein
MPVTERYLTLGEQSSKPALLQLCHNLGLSLFNDRDSNDQYCLQQWL